MESEPAKSGDEGKKNEKKKGVSDWVVLLGGNFGSSRDHHHASSISNNAYKATELMSKNQNNVSQRRFTHKCDVYSPRVILLKILTGKMPNGEGETSLVKWARRVARGEWTWERIETIGTVLVVVGCTEWSVVPEPKDEKSQDTAIQRRSCLFAW
ncbi:hypothetical protein NC653_039444 [Populus alba x Populus x berolinensis]|uniref:Uncharacterized protein n=1 Tax=Populus alba x Populus x berolinensis TaxID=444605 RepID=A0AAD6LB73_9ROSI|nr:hypothetical protein NC653_039444 [Populus alba x Populus x berolinensis]